MITIAVAGAAGRMGRMLVEAIVHADDLTLAAAFERPGHPDVGREVAAASAADRASVRIAAAADVRAMEAALAGIGVLIDFTLPAATLVNVEAARRARVSMVIGTTGFDAGGLAAIDHAAAEIGIVMAPNMSVGVNAMFRLVAIAAGLLGDEVDVEITEAHHRHKIDAPSGTAVRLGEIVAAALDRDYARDAVHGRAGVTGERTRREIGMHAVRGGDLVGEHTVLFAGEGERLEITHRASSRANFARGALRSARFVAGRAAGRYDMHDVLGLR